MARRKRLFSIGRVVTLRRDPLRGVSAVHLDATCVWCLGSAAVMTLLAVLVTARFVLAPST